jgi:plastocyanin domain-containing protein
VTPVGKIIKILLALTAAGLVAVASQGCKRAPEPGPALPTASANGTVDLKVTANGFEPSPVVLKKGQPVTLRVTRTTDDTCATTVVIPDYGIEKKLPLNEPVEIAFTPKKTGELKYGCAMGQMVSGVFKIE